MLKIQPEAGNGAYAPWSSMVVSGFEDVTKNWGKTPWDMDGYGISKQRDIGFVIFVVHRNGMIFSLGK